MLIKGRIFFGKKKKVFIAKLIQNRVQYWTTKKSFIMKSVKSKIIEKKSSSMRSIMTRVWPENENPTPLQFDRFIPWLCLQMHVSTLVTVERMTKEDYTLQGSHRVSSTRLRSIESFIQSKYCDFKQIKDSDFSSSSLPNYGGANCNAINIKSYYNHYNQLVEVAIIDCPGRINRKVIQAINLCLPFHELFKKFKIKGRGLTETVLYEIGKLLPHSNITDICLDDTYVPEGNYYVLLEKLNQLQNISLCRCKINDEVCKKIAENLNFESPASKTLRSLDLTSNRITNLGASYMGLMLRKNRSLLHLNLSDNIIGATGAIQILGSLMLFSLKDSEKYELKKRRFKYSAKKIEEYKKCEKNLLDRMKSEEDKENISTKHDLSLKTAKSKISKINKPVHVPAFDKLSSVKEQAERMTKDNIGEFDDVFDDKNVTYKDGKLYCIGNLELCYLNLAYNDIKYFSLEKLSEVLKYQSSIKSFPSKGLLKVVIEGNNIPVDCELLDIINEYLKKAVKKCLRFKDFSRSASSLGKKWQRKLVHSTS